MNNPLEFLKTQRSEHVVVPKVFLLGPPSSGKTTIANRLSLALDLELLTVEIVIKRLREMSPKSYLVEQAS